MELPIFGVYAHVHCVQESYKQHEKVVKRIADGETLSSGVCSITTLSSNDGALFNWTLLLEMTL